MDTLQELIFENKDKMPDGLYLQLQNELKKQHEKKSGLYEITYITNNLRLEERPSRFDKHKQELELVVKTAVIKLGDDDYYNYKKIKGTIDNQGWFRPARGFQDLSEKFFEVYYLHFQFDDDDEEVCNGNLDVALRTLNIENDMIITSIKEV